MTQTGAQKKVIKMLESKLYTRLELSNHLGLKYPTLRRRIIKGDWRQREIDIISTFEL